MPKAELGAKHTCESCGAKFYDMQKQPPTCPACGTVVEPEAKKKTRGSRADDAAKRKAVVVKSVEAEEVDLDGEIEEIEDEDEADTLLEDDEAEDDDDIGVGIGEETEEE